MQRITDEVILEDIFLWEGKKYTDIKDDLGGPTNHGITIPFYSLWLGRKATSDDIRNITTPIASAVYRSLIIRPLDILEDPLRFQVIDIAVHRGMRTAIMMLQGLIGAEVDGWIGSETLSLIRNMKNPMTNNLLVGARLQHFNQRIKENPSQKKFLNGWRKRALSFLVQME